MPRVRAGCNRIQEVSSTQTRSEPHDGLSAALEEGPRHRGSRQLRSEFEHQLTKGGCPACGYIEEAGEIFFSWFEIESFSATEVKARLRAAMGMCPAHARRLIEQIGGGHIMTTVMREALAGARECVSGVASRARCPACEADALATERATHIVTDALRDAGLRRMYGEHAGICLPHLVHATLVAEPTTLTFLAEQLDESLAHPERSCLVQLLAGRDRDALRRRSWREQLPAAPASDSTIGNLRGRLEIEACPVCLASGWGEERYLQWFVGQTHAGDPSIENDPGELCSVHLHDAFLADEALAAHAATHKRRARRTELRRLLEGIAQAPAAPRRGRRGREGALERSRAQFVTRPYCSACHAHAEIERSQLSLVAAAVKLGPVRGRYEQRHGLCAHHVLQLGANASADVLRPHAEARLAVLAWEVDEVARKYAWACRHEPRGPEQDAWVRAMAQLDGRVFEGAPPPRGESQ